MTRRVLVIGGGLAGLSAATMLASQGIVVELFEGANQAGGRCRSYYDPQLGQIIDNGNHLVLSGNHGVHDYLKRIGASQALAGSDRAQFAFMDVSTGERWQLSPNEGLLPWWITSKKRRVPGTTARDYLSFARLMAAKQQQKISDVLSCHGVLWEKLMRPFLLAALNTAPEDSSAGLAGQVIRETLAKGGSACHPRIASPTLAAAFVDPALRYLQKQGAIIHLGQRVRDIVFGHDSAIALKLAETIVPLTAGDAVILALPPWVAGEMVPGLTVPDDFRAIVNAHFKIAPNPDAPAMLGLIGGTAEWIFAFEDRVSVTVSGADALVDRDREELARLLWSDVAKAHGLPDTLPPWQIVKEKRATFAATPEQAGKRPKSATSWHNFFLAGDWTDTGLPATIEGAIRSGAAAAQLALRHASV